MPILQNERHEKYARERATGISCAEAARRAGYPHGPGLRNVAYNVEHRKEVVARVAELKLEHEGDGDDPTGRKALKLRLVEEEKAREEARRKKSRPTREQVMADLVATAEDAASAANFTARLRALELIGKELGMFVDRSIQITSPLDGLSSDQLVMLLRVIEQPAAPVIDVEAQPLLGAGSNEGEDRPADHHADAAQEGAAEVSV